MRSKPILAAVAFLAVLVLLVWQVSKAVHRTFGPPVGVAQVDKSTPRTQNQLTLLALQNVSPDRAYNYTQNGPEDGGGTANPAPDTDTGLWIKLPETANPPQTCGESEEMGCQKLITITGRTSTGETFPMKWRLSRYTAGSQPETCVLLTNIPGGYPNIVRWVDVNFIDAQGDKATWHITHLPPMQHVLGPSTKAQSVFQQGAIHAVVHAYSGPTPYPSPNSSPSTPVIYYDLKGTISPAAHQWELGHLKQTLEWEPPGFVPADSGSTMGAGKFGSTVTFEMEGQQVYFNQTTLYLADTHWVKLDAQLQEFETYDETVMFHNLSVVKAKNGSLYLAGTGPQTATTPDGVTVTLDDIQHRPILNNEWGDSDGYSLHLLYPQGMHFPSLTRSPLWRKYQRMVKISADIPKPYEARGSSYGDTEGTYHFDSSRPLSGLIANFPVIIHQRVDLSAVPMSFTLPVEQKKPRPQ